MDTPYGGTPVFITLDDESFFFLSSSKVFSASISPFLSSIVF